MSKAHFVNSEIKLSSFRSICALSYDHSPTISTLDINFPVTASRDGFGLDAGFACLLLDVLSGRLR